MSVDTNDPLFKERNKRIHVWKQLCEVFQIESKQFLKKLLLKRRTNKEIVHRLLLSTLCLKFNFLGLKY